MESKFATISFVKNIDEIPIKFKLFKKAPEKAMDWYIKKFNPYTIEEIEIADEMGINIKLPIIEKEIENKKELAHYIIEKTMNSLKERYVDIILPPANFLFNYNEEINVADGRHLLPFFLKQSILKALKILNKDIKTAEILVIGEDYNNVNTILDNIYEEVNFLTLMQPNTCNPVYEAKAAEIFNETGLNLHLCTKNISLIKSADIIINIFDEPIGSDFLYKAGCIYFDFSNNSAQSLNLYHRREDMLITDNFRVKLNNKTIPIEMFELAFFQKSKEYRQVVNKGYDPRSINKIKQQLLALEISLGSFCLKNMSLGTTHYSRILAHASRLAKNYK